jgi:hypothetical protein
VQNTHVGPTYLDVTLPAGSNFVQTTTAGSNAFVFVVEGSLAVGERQAVLHRRTLGILGEGERISTTAGPDGARFLLVSASPLNEPVARGGPFVMNTRAEILQAFDDYQNGRF